MKDKEDSCGGKLKVITFGNFAVKDSICNLADKYNSSLKLWELFKFFITYRDEHMLPEKIIDSIWPDNDYQDPKRALRALVFRLRKILGEHSGHDGKDIIVHSHGCYKLIADELYYVDVIEFEKIFQQASAIAKENSAKAIELYDNIISMYKSGYLAESYEYEWLTPTRNYYRRIFMQSISEISELLKAEKKYQQIIVICQNALKYEMLEEGIHFQYIEALAEMGKINQAKNHYQYVVDIFERELGIKPSEGLSDLYRLISGRFDKIRIDTDSILERLAEDTPPMRAILCGPEFFKLQYQLEKRRFERDGKPILIGLLTISLLDYTVPSEKKLKDVMEELREILLTTLRKGDVVAQWNEAQFIMNLPGPNVERANIALRRIHRRFLKIEKNENLVLHIKVDEIRPSKQRSDY